MLLAVLDSAEKALGHGKAGRPGALEYYSMSRVWNVSGLHLSLALGTIVTSGSHA